MGFPVEYFLHQRHRLLLHRPARRIGGASRFILATGSTTSFHGSARRIYNVFSIRLRKHVSSPAWSPPCGDRICLTECDLWTGRRLCRNEAGGLRLATTSLMEIRHTRANRFPPGANAKL